MELGIIAALGYLGNKINNFPNENSNSNNHNINLTYNNENKERVNNIMFEKSSIIEDSKYPDKTNIINNSIKSIKNISPNYKSMSSTNSLKMFESFNQSLNNNHNSYEDQFKPLIFDNKKTPVSSNNLHKTLKKNVKKEKNLNLNNSFSLFDNKSIDMTYNIISQDNFTHDNMVPHYSKGQMINEYNEQTLSHKMDLFTGSSRNFYPKRELLQENFTPVQKDVNLIGTSKSKTDILESYYIPSKERRNELSFEQINVGPGLNLNPHQTTRPDNSRYDDFRPLPKATNELRSADRPKESYKSQVIPGKRGDRRSVIGETFKRRPDKTKENKPSEYQRSGGIIKKDKNRNPVILKNTNRRESRQIIGPSRFKQNRASNKNISKTKPSTKRENFSSIPSNVNTVVKGFDTNKKSFNILETRRNTTEHNEYAGGPSKLEFGGKKYDPNDLPKQTKKQTTIYNEQYGTITGPDANKSYDPKDVMAPNMRDITTFNNNRGYMGRSDTNKNQSYDPRDRPDITNRDILQYNDVGNTRGVENKTQSYNPDNVLRETNRNTTQYNNEIGNTRGVENKVISHDPTYLLRQTNRDTTQYNNLSGNARGVENKTQTHNPSNILNTTNRELTQMNSNGFMTGNKNYTQTHINDMLNSTLRESQNDYPLTNVKGGVNKTQYYDSSDVSRTTGKEGLIYNNNVINTKGEVNKTQYYNPNDVARYTGNEDFIYNNQSAVTKGMVNKNQSFNPEDMLNVTNREQTVYTKDLSHAKNDINKPHYYNPDDVTKNTIRELTTITERSGNIMSSNNKSKVFNPNDIPAATLKELLIKQYHMGIAEGNVKFSPTFNPEDIPATTLKEMCVINNYLSTAQNKNDRGGYLSSKYEAPETLRQLIQILRFGGAFGDQKPKNYGAEKNMEIDERKEKLIQSRDPTNRKHNIVPNTNINLGNTKLRNENNLDRFPVKSNFNLGNNLPTKYTKNVYKNEDSNRLNPDILNQLNENPLVNNIVNNKKNDNNPNCNN